MDFITLEGVDGTGKSTAHRGFYEEIGARECNHTPGVVDLLSESLERPVYASREPGRYRQDEDWWDPPGLLDVERNLNRALQWMGTAWTLLPEDAEWPRRVLVAAAFTYKYDAFPNGVAKACREDGQWPGTFLSERQQMKGEWEHMTKLMASDPTLRRRMNGYDARDAIRHALIGAVDSHVLDPTTSGLLFFANHILHARWLSTLEDDALVISDRAGESNLAYGRARGDDPRVEELYLTERPIEPDLVYVLTCEREEIINRVGGREKLENKGWDSPDTMMKAQEAYVSLSSELDCTFEFLNTTSVAPSPMIGWILGGIKDQLGLEAKVSHV